MKTITKWLILFALIVAALICYAYGLSAGAVGFVIAGLVFEMLFWFGVLRAKKDYGA